MVCHSAKVKREAWPACSMRQNPKAEDAGPCRLEESAQCRGRRSRAIRPWAQWPMLGEALGHAGSSGPVCVASGT